MTKRHIFLAAGKFVCYKVYMHFLARGSTPDKINVKDEKR